MTGLCSRQSETHEVTTGRSETSIEQITNSDQIMLLQMPVFSQFELHASAYSVKGRASVIYQNGFINLAQKTIKNDDNFETW
jgi:hypothetical protein